MYDCVYKKPWVDELVKSFLSLLEHKHSVVSVLGQRLYRKLCLFRGKNHISLEEVSRFVQAEIAGNAVWLCNGECTPQGWQRLNDCLKTE